MNEIKINTARLGTDAAQVISLINDMDNRIKNMKAHIDQLNGMWDGPAKQAFVQVFEDDRAAAEDVIKELKSLHGFETQAKEKYDKCEQQVAALVDAIKI
jgi:WXG100 family type VII secretion target